MSHQIRKCRRLSIIWHNGPIRVLSVPPCFGGHWCPTYSTTQSWALEVFLHFFNNKKLLFAFFIKLIWLRVGFLNRTGAEISYSFFKKCNKIIFEYWKHSKIPKVPSSAKIPTLQTDDIAHRIVSLASNNEQSLFLFEFFLIYIFASCKFWVSYGRFSQAACFSQGEWQSLSGVIFLFLKDTSSGEIKICVRYQNQITPIESRGNNNLGKEVETFPFFFTNERYVQSWRIWRGRDYYMPTWRSVKQMVY